MAKTQAEIASIRQKDTELQISAQGESPEAAAQQMQLEETKANHKMQLDETKFQHEASLQERRMQMEQENHEQDQALKADAHEHQKQMQATQARVDEFNSTRKEKPE
jgi:hypothetical protein